MEARFEALVPRIIDAIRKDGNDEVVKVISARLRAEFANPRAEDLERSPEFLLQKSVRGRFSFFLVPLTTKLDCIQS